MALTEAERLEMGFSMLAAAKELIEAGLPRELTGAARRRAVYERLHGEPLPEQCPV